MRAGIGVQDRRDGQRRRRGVSAGDNPQDDRPGPGTGRVRRRRVFYIPGYDPIPPRRYRELYRKEAAAQAAVSGHEIALRPGAGGARFGWRVTARIEGQEAAADITVLGWSDIVKQSMAQGI